MTEKHIGKKTYELYDFRAIDKGQDLAITRGHEGCYLMTLLRSENVTIDTAVELFNKSEFNKTMYLVEALYKSKCAASDRIFETPNVVRMPHREYVKLGSPKTIELELKIK